MGVYDGGISVTGGGSYTLRLTTSEANVNEAANTSAVAWELKIIRNSGFAFRGDTATSWNVTINGSTAGSGNFSYNFGSYSELVLGGSTTGPITHNDDGSKSVSVSGSISGPGPITGGSTSGTQDLSNFSRPPLAPASCTVTVSGRNATVTSGLADVTNRPAITSYQVEATTNDGVTWSGTVNTMDGSRQYVYTSLDGGKYYKFRTRGVNSEGAGAWTESSSTFIPAGGRRWNGSTWEPTTIAKRWDGSAWVDLTIAKRWNGSAWVDLT